MFLNDGDDAKAVVTEMDGSTVVFSARKTDAGVEVPVPMVAGSPLVWDLAKL